MLLTVLYRILIGLMPFDPSDAVFLLFLVIVIWLAFKIDGDWGGGKRLRVRAY